MPQKNPFLQAALAYVKKLHWPVFPLKPRTKDPHTPHGFKDASLDEEQIRKWWKKWPQANIGVPTGIAFWVLDVDPRHGGDDTLETILLRHTRLPNTIEQITGGGGKHYLFQPDEHVRSGPLGPLTPGIDIKSTGGYIVVAPSIHPNGQPYAWDGLKSITEETIAAAPPWLLLEIAGSRNGGSSAIPRVAPQKIAKGVQHATLVSMAGSMRRRGCEFEEIYALLEVMNRTRCTEPGPDENIRQIAESVCRYAPEKLVPETAVPAEALEPPPAEHGAATVTVEKLTATVELLNALTVFGGKVAFTAVRRRGPMIIATTDQNCEVVWPGMEQLSSFLKSRDLIADCTGIFLNTPPQRRIRAMWEPAASLLLRLGGANGILVENALREETRDLVRLMWRQAGQPAAQDGGKFIIYMREILSSRRDPKGEAPPSVFLAEDSTWVHLPTWRTWLSTPNFMNRLYPLGELRNGLLLLGFAYFENLSRGFEGDSESLCLWRGPIEVLE